MHEPLVLKGIRQETVTMEFYIHKRCFSLLHFPSNGILHFLHFVRNTGIINECAVCSQ